MLLPGGREWAGYFGTRHFCLFDVEDNSIQMKVLASSWPGAIANIKDLRGLDQKTFKPRN